jgi:cobalt transporter subunit CbtB
LGSFLLLGVGFADSHLIHNAAHDARHAHSFPCH